MRSAFTSSSVTPKTWVPTVPSFSDSNGDHEALAAQRAVKRTRLERSVAVGHAREARCRKKRIGEPARARRRDDDKLRVGPAESVLENPGSGDVGRLRWEVRDDILESLALVFRQRTGVELGSASQRREVGRRRAVGEGAEDRLANGGTKQNSCDQCEPSSG